MFDIGILEIGLIAVVALLVIGPERLPAVARTVGYWFGKTRKFVLSVQEDFNRELTKSEELKNLLEEQAKIKDVHEIIEQTVDETRKTVSVSANLTPPLDVLPDKKDSSSDNTVENEGERSKEQHTETKPEKSQSTESGSR
ncbi:Sec-independent protein translocase protein TatB [Kaarinaea lacus]